MLWKGVNTCRGIAASVLGVLELNWEMLAAGINVPFFVFPSLPSLLLNFWVFCLHSVVKASLAGRENYTKSDQAGQSIEIK